MSENKEQLGIAKWDNEEQSYIPLAIVTPIFPELKKSTFTVQRIPTYTGKLPVGLSAVSNSNVPPLLSEFVPKGFANRVLSQTYEGWDNLSDYMKLKLIGDREMGSYKIFDLSPSRGSSPIPESAAEALVEKVIVLESEQQLNKLLNSENFYSLTTMGGEKPKFEYENSDGQRFVVKVSDAITKSLRNDEAKLQHLLTKAQIEAGINAAHSELFVTSRLNTALLSRRYDFIKSATSDNVFKFQKFGADSLSRMSVSYCYDFSESNKRSIDRLVDIINCLCKENEETDSREELMRRHVFASMTNQTNFSFNSVELIETDAGHFNLSPSTPTMPDRSGTNDMLLAVEGYENRHSMTFDNKHIDKIASAFQVSRDSVERAVAKTYVAVSQIQQKAAELQVAPASWEHFMSKMLPPNLSNVVELTKKFSDQARTQATQAKISAPTFG